MIRTALPLLPLLLLAVPIAAEEAEVALARALVAAADADGDGALSAEEAGRIGPAFAAALDADGDGLVSRGEWIAMAPGGVPLVPEAARTSALEEALTQLYDRMDASGEVSGATVEGEGPGDGLVGAFEIGGAFAVDPAADMDGDGTLSVAEVALGLPIVNDLAPILLLGE